MGRHSKKRSVLVYIPEELHRWLKAKAAIDGTTLSAVIEQAARASYPEAPSDSRSNRILTVTSRTRSRQFSGYVTTKSGGAR